MKRSHRLSPLILALSIGLAGCSGSVPDLGSESGLSAPSPASESQTVPEPEAAFPLKGVEGDYVVLEKGDWAGPEDHVSLKGAIQESGTVILLWEIGNREESESAVVEVADASTGSVRYRYFPDEWCDSIEADGAQTFRLNTADGIIFLDGFDGQSVEKYALPDTVRGSLWVNDGEAVPGLGFDVQRSADLTAYLAADGIYLCDLEGNNSRKVLDNASIPSWFNYWGVDKTLPPYEPAQLHYIAPLLMNGGKILAATTYLVGNGDYESLCVGVTTINLETQKVSNYPDPLNWLSPPARRVGTHTLMTITDAGYQFIDVSTELPEDILFGDEELTDVTSDYRTYLRFQPDFEVDGKKTTALVSFPGENVGEMVPHLTVAGWQYVQLLGVTDQYALCKVSAADGESELLLAAYR